MKLTQIMVGTGFGGAERLFVDLSLSLAARGHTVQTICHRDFIRRDLLASEPNIEISPVNVWGAWDLLAPFQMRKHLRQFGPDIVHLHLSRAASLGGRAAHPLPVPVVATMHNYHKLKNYKRVHEIACITPDMREYLLGKGVASERVTVIPNFARFPAVEAPRAIPSDPIRFVACGRLHQVKGYDLLLRALRLVLDAGGHAQLTIGGDGPEKGALLALTRELGLEKSVEFVGWVDDVSTFLDRHDVFILSSRAEPFGIVILEAMSRGLPIIATRTAGPLQTLCAESALLVDVESPQSLAQAMLQAGQAPAALVPLASEALARYRTQYSESVGVPRYIEFYERAMASTNRR